MKKLIIGILAVVVVAAAAGAGYMMFIKKDSLFSSKSNSGDSGTAQQAPASTSEFAPVATDTESLTATITTTAKNGKKSSAIMMFDGKGNSQYEISAGEGSTKIIYTKQAYYSCSKNDCTKFPITNGQTNDVDPETYQVSSSDIAAAKNGAVYEGQESCSTGTCHVWNVSGFSAGGGKAKMYIDTKTSKVAQIDSESIDGGQVKMVYEYGPVTIDIPQNARELPSGI